MRYYSPAPPLRRLLSSYYVVEIGPGRITDVMRAELPNVRFVIRGHSDLTWPGGIVRRGYDASVFGPRSLPLGMVLEGPALVFGAGIMPDGWTRFFGIDSDELADEMLPLEDLAPGARSVLCRMQNGTSDKALVAAADAFFLSLARRRPVRDDAGFGMLVENWLVRGSPGGIDQLIAASDRSARQVERLCRRTYGAPPKLLLRKYRALRSAVGISLDPDARWMDIAGDDFYDQSHFIREFRTFVGMTPTQFAANGAAVMSHSIRLRRQLPTLPRLSLVS
ncbi:helix-turn-helix domain-containing protein [Sphingosinicella soli]|uniref:AraC-like DNA-binding protein n=1 Tax=Sphingosinicella soli TaxID=333708 RepID=A0A7W7B1H1_9SPHN|nr:AraC family transcriptional regulator [Sphingosinicella soli]MBB4631278.1 AraC-like DNA-binding protein [Sphingosinicella soli]